MKDYISWGQEYLNEAEKIKERLLFIRAESRKKRALPGEQDRRVQLLYTMYLECLLTGRQLKKRGEERVS